MFAALGSCASIQYIQEKSSACVEVLRKISHNISSWAGSRDLNRRHNEVSIRADIAALCLDLGVQSVHTFSKRTISLPMEQTRQKKGNNKKSCAVKDVLLEGRSKLIEHNMFEDWKNRTMGGGLYEETDVYGDEVDDDMVFGDPSGELAVDTAMDAEFTDCPFSNADVNDGREGD